MTKKLTKVKLEGSSGSEPEDNNSENIKYFLSLLGLSQYDQVFTENKITSLAKLRCKWFLTQKSTRPKPRPWASL